MKKKLGRPRNPKRRVRNPKLTGLQVEWLVASETKYGIIRMFGILVNEMCWIYFSLDPFNEPTCRQDIWKRIERGDDDEMRQFMYSMLLFAEDPETERFARRALEILNDTEYLDS